MSYMSWMSYVSNKRFRIAVYGGMRWNRGVRTQFDRLANELAREPIEKAVG